MGRLWLDSWFLQATRQMNIKEISTVNNVFRWSSFILKLQNFLKCETWLATQQFNVEAGMWKVNALRFCWWGGHTGVFVYCQLRWLPHKLWVSCCEQNRSYSSLYRLTGIVRCVLVLSTSGARREVTMKYMATTHVSTVMCYYHCPWCRPISFPLYHWPSFNNRSCWL